MPKLTLADELRPPRDSATIPTYRWRAVDPTTERLNQLIERTRRLQAVTARLSTALRIPDVAEIILGESATALGAMSAGMWRLDPAASELVLLGARNYPDAALAMVQILPLGSPAPVAESGRTGEAIFLTSRADYETRYPSSAQKSRALEQPASHATAALPIVLDGHVLGVLALTFAGERPFDEDERAYLTYLAVHCAQGFDRARLYEAETQARKDAETARNRALFLARASELLGSSLDYEQTLRNVAALAVPGMADWCGIDLVDEASVLLQVAVAHVDPDKIQYAHELRKRYPPDPKGSTGAPNVMRTGVSELYAEIPDALLVAGAIDDEHLRISRALGLSSAMVVPIKDRGRTVGAISFIYSDARRYTPDDVVMGEQLGERAGVAIANAKLYDQATSAIRLRDEFLLIAGHELRTPLAALMLHHQSLAQAPETMPISKVRERAKKLVDQSDRLGRLIEELLDVSRITAGRVTLAREELDLAVLVEEVVGRMTEDPARKSSVHLVAESAIGSWDRGRIDQVVTNLVANAFKYGGGEAIDVRLHREPAHAVLSVRDRGIGIALADQKRIFDRFERAVSPRNFGGLGLGLWIVRQLLEAHGGTIDVESTPGQGSTFTVRLPL